MSAAQFEQLLADLEHTLGPQAGLRPAALHVERRPVARAEEATVVAGLLADHPTGWICTGDAVHVITDGRASRGEIKLHQVLSGELVDSTGQRTVHLRRHGAELVAHELRADEGAPTMLVEERAFVSNASDEGARMLRYAVYWSAGTAGEAEAAVTTYRQTHARFLGLGDK